jgi:hypothetical protein
VPLKEEGKEGKKERGDDQSSKMNFEEKRDWQSCLLVRQVTPTLPAMLAWTVASEFTLHAAIRSKLGCRAAK